MTKWMYRLLGIGILVAVFNIIRLVGGNPVLDIGFMLITIPIAVKLIFDNKEDVIKKEDEES